MGLFSRKKKAALSKEDLEALTKKLDAQSAEIEALKKKLEEKEQKKAQNAEPKKQNAEKKSASSPQSTAKKEKPAATQKPKAQTAAPDAAAVVKNNLMISQYAAYYTAYGDDLYRKTYLEKTKALGISGEEAQQIFRFECDVCKKYNKQYLLLPEFVKVWFMGLRQPFLLKYPKTKDDICKEFFFTIGELSKFMDEAEWHFWNSHEDDLSDEVWSEIFEWRTMGGGGTFVLQQYLPAVTEKYSVSNEALLKLVNHYGSFLNKYKWG